MLEIKTGYVKGHFKEQREKVIQRILDSTKITSFSEAMIAAVFVAFGGYGNNIGTGKGKKIEMSEKLARKRKGIRWKENQTLFCSEERSSMHSIKNSTFLSINGVVDKLRRS